MLAHQPPDLLAVDDSPLLAECSANRSVAVAREHVADRRHACDQIGIVHRLAWRIVERGARQTHQLPSPADREADGPAITDNNTASRLGSVRELPFETLRLAAHRALKGSDPCFILLQQVCGLDVLIACAGLVFRHEAQTRLRERSWCVASPRSVSPERHSCEICRLKATLCDQCLAMASDL